MDGRAQSAQRPIAGKTAKAVDGRAGKFEAHSAFRAGKKPVLLHMGKEYLIQPGFAGRFPRQVRRSGADAADDLGKIRQSAGVGQAFRQGRALALCAGAGSVQAAQKRLERQKEAFAVVFEE